MTNDSYLHINKHIPLSDLGGAGVSALTFANTPDRFSLPKFFTKTPYDQAHPNCRKVNH
jgi:hypothetical protein